ncbi:MAG: phage tail protein [Candidatus Korobacteraceae bacterium]
MSGCSNGQVNFFVLDTAVAWTGSQAEGSVSIGDGGLALPVSTDYATAQVVPSTQFPAGVNIGSIAPAACGIVYLLDAASHTVWTYDSNQSLFNRVPAVAGLLKTPVAIAHQNGTLFVADTEGNVRIFALALLTGQIRWTAGGDVASADGSVKLSGFAPVALVPGPHGDLYALDSKNSAVLHFDAHGQLLESLVITTQGADLTAIARARDATLYVLVGTQQILKRAPRGTFADFLPASGATSPTLNAASLAVDSNGTIYIGEPSSSGSSSGGSTGLNTGIISRFDPSGKSLGSLPAYSGWADLLAADCADNLYALQSGPTLSLLESASSYLVPSNTPPLQANYRSTAFDSGSSGTVWHRLVIDADLPANTQLLVYFYASDNSADDPTNKWLPPLLNATDALLINARGGQNSPVVGRYLWLMVTLVGTEDATPLVRAIRIYFPRVSYLRYLPAIYSQDPTSRDFLQRFLSIFESIFSGLETTTTNLVRYFDPRVVTGEFLQWLAQWLAISVDNTWTDDQLRTLLLEAPDLFRERGTPSQIAEVVRIYLGIAPFIIEQFQLACAQSSDIQQVYDNLYGSGEFCFCLLVPPYQQLGTAAKGTTTTYPDTDKTAAISANSIELVLGSHTYEIPLKGPNTLDVLRNAINCLGVGVVAEVLSGPPRTSYSQDSSDQWIGPGGVTDETTTLTAGATTGNTPPAYYLELRAKRIGPRDLELRTTAGVKSTNILQSNDSGSYTVVSPWSQENRDALQRILDQEKPAHTCGGIQVLQPRILLDMHSYLEVNSWLVKPSPMLDTGAAMPLDSVVDDATPIGQAGVRARIGLDTVLG